MKEDVGARVTPASINLVVHAPRTRKSKNGLRANTALCPRAPGLRSAKKSLASPRQGVHPKEIPCPPDKVAAIKQAFRHFGLL